MYNADLISGIQNQPLIWQSLLITMRSDVSDRSHIVVMFDRPAAANDAKGAPASGKYQGHAIDRVISRPVIPCLHGGMAWVMPTGYD